MFVCADGDADEDVADCGGYDTKDLESDVERKGNRPCWSVGLFLYLKRAVEGGKEHVEGERRGAAGGAARSE